ncbi:MAG: hypothetical protein JRI68_16395 [Deltaproteobacteria bacterium]|nr:hypothetical protein [Deltaproteobacteria bacterium]
MKKTAFWTALVVIAAGPAVAGLACSGDEDVITSNGVGGGGGSGAGGTAGSGQGGNLFPDGGCSPGQACGDGGICTDDGECCSSEAICGGDCCVDPEICAFQQCVTPGDVCVDATDCGPDEYCDYALGETQGGSGGAGGGCQGGIVFQTGKCLPKPPKCNGQDPGDPPTCLETCEYHPPTSQFSPELKFAWGSLSNTNHDVMMAPIVTQLDDDNCDGDIDERDLPDIVFFTFAGSDYNNNLGNSATLRAISIVDGTVVNKWSVATTGDAPGRSIASGDIHPSPGNEIVVCTTNSRVRAYDATGSPLWLSESIGISCLMPSIADMDQDGDAEVVVRSRILEGDTGAVQATLSPANNSYVVVSDVTGDGKLNVVSPTAVYDEAGNQLIDVGINGTHAAVGDLDVDGIPEIVSVYRNTHSMSVWHLDPNEPTGYVIIRQDVDINGTISPNPCCQINPNSAGCTTGGGPPTIADFNGDGFPDVALAGGIGYAVFDGQKLMDPQNVPDNQTMAWLKQTQDCSSAQTGSSVFDFNGDGLAEVVYADEVTLHIYDGVTGDDVWSTCNTSGTLLEYPLVADVDSDGHADLIVASNRYSSLNCNGTKTTGIRIFGDTQGNWVRTRRIWNQHPYHVTNVNEDGTIPQFEAPNYLDPKLNNFRQNVQPLGEFSAPDLVVSVFPSCLSEYTIVARVRNIGEASVPPGVVVGFYEGDPAAGGTKLGEALTTQTLYSLGSEDVPFVPQSPVVELLYAVVDDGSPPHPWHECRDDNNVSEGTDPSCGPR